MIKPGLTLHRLKLFLAVLDRGGVARAAEAENISQPAVSEHLRGLEAHFSVRLLERVGRRVQPTAVARLIEPYARQVVGLLRAAEHAAEQWKGLRTGVLAIGGSTTPGTYLLPAALGRFRKRHPGVDLRLRIGNTEEIEGWVGAGELELGVIGEAPRHPGLAADPWVDDELVLIVGRLHPIARRSRVRPDVLETLPYIAREPGSSTRRVTERYLGSLGLTLKPVMELGSTEAIREAVAAGLGVAMVSRHAVRPRDARVVALRVAGAPWTRRMVVIRRAETPLSPAAQRFREVLLGTGP